MYDINTCVDALGKRIINHVNRENVIAEINKKLAMTDLWSYDFESSGSNYKIYRCFFAITTDTFVSIETMKEIVETYKENGYRVNLFGNKDCTHENPGYGLEFQVFIKIYYNGKIELVN